MNNTSTKPSEALKTQGPILQSLCIGTLNTVRICIVRANSPLAEMSGGMIQSPTHLKVVLNDLLVLDQEILNRKSITLGTLVDLIRLKAHEIKVAFLPTEDPNDTFLKMAIIENGDFLQFAILVGSCKKVLSC